MGMRVLYSWNGLTIQACSVSFTEALGCLSKSVFSHLTAMGNSNSRVIGPYLADLLGGPKWIPGVKL